MTAGFYLSRRVGLRLAFSFLSVVPAMSAYPEIFRVRQRLERPQVADVAAETEAQLARLQLGQKVKPGQSVAITMGSRGIANIHLITRAIVQHFLRLGA